MCIKKQAWESYKEKEKNFCRFFGKIAKKIFIFNFIICFFCNSYELKWDVTMATIGLSIYAIRLAKECTGWKLETKWEKCLGPYRWKFLYVQSASPTGNYCRRRRLKSAIFNKIFLTRVLEVNSYFASNFHILHPNAH